MASAIALCALLDEVLAGGSSPHDVCTVRREWQNINILVESPSDRLVVIIENKIWTGEHSSQLECYLSIVKWHYA